MSDIRTSGRTVDVARYLQVRAHTERLAEPLSAEDQTIQSMPDASPTKWHRAHTSWFFETFVLGPFDPGYQVFDSSFAYLFNSYYEAVGPRHPRPQRGLITRPGAEEISRYRRHVDDAMGRFIEGAAVSANELVELGLHHEQQHQELVLMDVKHALSMNPLAPVYRADGPEPSGPCRPGFISHDGGIVEVGHPGDSFCFDNETPVHQVMLRPFALAAGLVTNGQWMEFMADGGYHRPELWLSDGWATARTNEWESPLYWSRIDGEWWQFSLAGLRRVDAEAPVCHVSLFEADAFAHWAGARLPTEFEWEAVAAGTPGSLGQVWQWTSSAYAPYPGFRPNPGAVGEYNGKFMVNQYVLRGGSCATPAGHARATYRNFFPAASRWMFAGLRLAHNG
ncbi:MAG TPA: ergothioneine biosynthesis protein EgtB [Acidimicrobiales bacterium]|nr:ergothioneine biosynthesis protein EgtB [Acidimicrobiales bacterium]